MKLEADEKGEHPTQDSNLDLDRLEGDCPSMGRVGLGEPRGNQTLARGFANHDPRQRIGSERTEGIEPTSTVWKTVALPLDDVRAYESRSSARPPRWAGAFREFFGTVESARVELASPGCKPGVLPLHYDPAGRVGIEPSLLVLETRTVTMTLRPKKNGDKRAKRFIAPNWADLLEMKRRCSSASQAEVVGIEPMYSSRHSPGAS
jgi:hypothetical protein